MAKTQVVIRSIEEDDKNLIYNAWLVGFADSYFAYGIPKALYYEVHAEIISGLLGAGKVLVAANPEDLNQIFGFLCYSPSYTQQKLIMHYIYVKNAYKRLGIATALIEAMRTIEDTISDDAPLVGTHMTSDGRFLKKQGIVYNPYLLFRGPYGYSQSV